MVVAVAADPIAIWLRQLSQLGADMGEVSADVGRAVDVELRSQIASGLDPNGKPWPRLQDGGQPLTGIGSYLRVAVVPGAVVARLTGLGAMHHQGAVRGGVRRQILPDAGTVPAPVAQAVRVVLDRRFAALTRGTS